jgi:transposase-like protein
VNLADGGIASENTRASEQAKEGGMEIAKRACPECGGGNYAFRSRRQIEATAEKPAELETKYRCKDCESEWKERTPGVLRKAPPPE